MLTLNAVTLRPFRDDDIAMLVAARNDLSLEAASQPTEPVPRAAAVFQRRLDAGATAISSGGANDIEFAVTRSDDDAGRAIGIAGLYELDRFNSNAEVGVTIADPAARRTGIGIDCYLALAHYAFQTLGLHKVYGHTKANNEAAVGTMARLGLAREGVLRQHRWINGSRVDLHVYSLLAAEWDPRLVHWRAPQHATSSTTNGVEH